MSKLNSGHYDVVVLGVGSMGSAACWFLAAGGHPDAGFVTPELAVEQYVHDARKKEAVIKTGTKVISWRQEGSKVRIITDEEEYTGDKLVITAGAWASGMIP